MKIKPRVKEIFARQYDRLFGFRIIDALRNYVQHRALPIDQMVFPRDAQDRNNGTMVRFRVREQLRVKDLLEDPEFRKKKVANEVGSFPKLDYVGSSPISAPTTPSSSSH